MHLYSACLRDESSLTQHAMQSCDGLLNLIDLAGSERLSGVTKAEGGASLFAVMHEDIAVNDLYFSAEICDRVHFSVSSH